MNAPKNIPPPLGICPKCIETGQAGVETETGWIVQLCPHRQVAAVYIPECKYWTIFTPCTPAELVANLQRTKERLNLEYKGATIQ